MPGVRVFLGMRWSRVIVFVAASLLVAVSAGAQAPPPSFFDGRSTDDLRRLASDPQNDVLVRRVAASRLVVALADRGDVDAADAAAREFAKNIDPAAPRHLAAVRKRASVHRVAVVALASALAVALASLARAGRAAAVALGALRRIWPLALLYAAYVALAGGYLASDYENGDPAPFYLFGASLLPVLALFRAWSAVGSRGAAARAGRAIAAVTVTAAIGVLVVELDNPAYLQGFGLSRAAPCRSSSSSSRRCSSVRRRSCTHRRRTPTPPWSAFRRSTCYAARCRRSCGAAATRRRWTRRWRRCGSPSSARRHARSCSRRCRCTCS
jgi:hypothetical protein